MDPWSSSPNSSESSFDDSCNITADSFEDNFKPTVSDTLPDSKQYLETLGNYTKKCLPLFNC